MDPLTAADDIVASPDVGRVVACVRVVPLPESAPTSYLCERSVCLVLHIRREWPAEASRPVSTVAKRLDARRATSRLWMNQAEAGQDLHSGTTMGDAERIAKPERGSAS